MITIGGPGSGRWYRTSAKSLVEACRTINVWRWHNDGLLTPNRLFSWAWWGRDGTQKSSIGVYVYSGFLEFSYTANPQGESPQLVKYRVALDYQECHFGGKRPFFVCPSCGNRAVKMYLSDAHFLCRKCHGLAYESQREKIYDRMLNKCQKIRIKLGGSPSTFDAFPAKPKRMHYKTYNKLRFAALRREEAMFGAIAKSLNL